MRRPRTGPGSWNGAAGAAVLLAALPLPGCGPGAEIPGVEAPPPPEAAVAVLHPTKGHDVRGVVRFEPGELGLRVHSEVSGLEPNGTHAYHVHLWGDCSAPDGTSAGTHFNFEGSSQDPPEDIQRITGNLGDLRANTDGRADHSTTVEAATLTGPKGVVGRSVVVHARANDPDQPPIGAAGPRLACGVIGIAEPD